MEPSLIQAIISGIVGIVGGGFFGQWWSFKKESKAQNSIDFSAIIKTWQEDNVRLRQLEEESRNRITELESKVNSLQNKLILLESATQDLPIPMWLKDLDGRMLSLNRAYEYMFLLPNGKKSSDYIGKTDYELWPKDIADSYAGHDQEVIFKKKLIKAFEVVPVRGEDKEFLIIKFPRLVGKTVVGVAGIAIDTDLKNIK